MSVKQQRSSHTLQSKVSSRKLRTTWAIIRGLGLTGSILSIQACSSLPLVDLAEKPATPKVAATPSNKEAACTSSKSEINLPSPQAAPVPVNQVPPRSQIKAGECWAPTVILSRRVSTALEIVTKDAVNNILVRPASIEPMQRSRIVREGTHTYRVEPPVYRKIKEKILVREEIRRSVVEPALFETRKEKIEVEAAHEKLVPCRTLGQSSTSVVRGQGLCVEAVSARYKTLTRKILIKPETTREQIEPAIYREVSKWVIEAPARAVEIKLPEKTQAFTVQAVETPEQIDETQLPPKIVHLDSISYEGVPTPTWSQTPCAEDMTPELIKQLQTALKKAGFQVGASDGKLGKRTLASIQSYQIKHGLATGALTLETMQHLGLVDKP